MFRLSPTVLQGWKVLVVEDDPDSLMVAQTLLERCGAQVLTASNGQEGLELAEAHHPRFILMDLSMPIMDGWEMLKHLQEQPQLAQIPAIALTAHAMKADRERAMAAGFFNHLAKPLSPKNFVQNLLALLFDEPTLHDDLLQHLERTE